MKIIFSIPAVGLLCLFLMISAAPVMAQGEETSPQVKPPSRSELEMAAKAYVQILEIQEHYQMSIEEDMGQEERLNLQKEADRKREAAVREAGLDVERYNEIVLLVRSDDDLIEEFAAKIKSID